MNTKPYKKDRRVWATVAIIYTVGLIGFLVPAWHNVFVWLIPVNLLFAFVMLCLGEERFTPKKALLAAVCYTFGFLYELAGTKTGLLFGEYTYDTGLGIKLWDVPLLIGLNWFFMVYTSLGVASKITASRAGLVFLAPAFMVLYDVLLEPFAVRHHMWTWAGGTVPLQNYGAWYAGGWVLCAFTVWGRFDFKNRYAAGLFGVQILFFTVLYFFG